MAYFSYIVFSLFFINNTVLSQTATSFLDEHGCYTIILQLDGVRPVPKTFFPANWSRSQVIDKILEAYESFKASGVSANLARDGKYEIIGLTQEGIQIKMHITQDGIIKSAYPIVNGV